MTKYKGWNKILGEKGWKLIYTTNWGTPVYIIICTKHRDSLCYKCKAPPKSLIKKARILQKMQQYET